MGASFLYRGQFSDRLFKIMNNVQNDECMDIQLILLNIDNFSAFFVQDIERISYHFPDVGGMITPGERPILQMKA